MQLLLIGLIALVVQLPNAWGGPNDVPVPLPDVSADVVEAPVVAPVPEETPPPPPATPALDVSGFEWDEPGPYILRTSQVFGGEARQTCGSQSYEVCIGPATKGDEKKLIKCFIPANSLNCPTTISTNERCYGADEVPPTDVGSIPACSTRPPETSRGCHCGGIFYRGERVVKRNRAECATILTRMQAEERRRAEAANPPPSTGFSLLDEELRLDLTGLRLGCFYANTLTPMPGGALACIAAPIEPSPEVAAPANPTPDPTPDPEEPSGPLVPPEEPEAELPNVDDRESLPEEDGETSLPEDDEDLDDAIDESPRD